RLFMGVSLLYGRRLRTAGRGGAAHDASRWPPPFGTVIMMARMATTTMKTLKYSATEPAKRRSTLSVRPMATSAKGPKLGVLLRARKMAAEMETPKAAPSDDAILYSPEAAPATSSGTFDSAASVDGVA